MKLRELASSWSKHHHEPETPVSMTVNLSAENAAKLAALSELHTPLSTHEILADLINAALREVESSFPYVKGDNVVATDEMGDPLFEDTGLTPRYIELTRKHLRAHQER